MQALKISLIGAGNVAWNLASALLENGHSIVQVFANTQTSIDRFLANFDTAQGSLDPSDLRQDLDLVIIATSDHVIAEIANTYAPFRGPNTAFVHTSGSIHVDALAPLGPHTGVFYPLQTFTKAHRADFRSIPFFLEGPPEVLNKIRPLAEQLSDNVRDLDSQGRLTLHLGAVFASNFANFMWMLADETLADLPGVDMKAYVPLIREVVDKALAYGPHDAHTGPARRGDQVTMEKHMAILQDQDPERAALYAQLSRMIAERFS